MSNDEQPARDTAIFCQLLQSLSSRAAVEGWHSSLTVFASAVRDGTVMEAQWREFWRSIGLSQTVRNNVWIFDVQGQDANPPNIELYRCPKGLCDHAVQRGPGGTLPVCGLFDSEPLIRGMIR